MYSDAASIVDVGDYHPVAMVEFAGTVIVPMPAGIDGEEKSYRRVGVDRDGFGGRMVFHAALFNSVPGILPDHIGF